VTLIEKSEEYICFLYLKFILEIDAESRKIYFPARCSCTEVEILSIDECDIFGFHILKSKETYPLPRNALKSVISSAYSIEPACGRPFESLDIFTSRGI
jgi:hypothetical protein